MNSLRQQLLTDDFPNDFPLLALSETLEYLSEAPPVEPLGPVESDSHYRGHRCMSVRHNVVRGLSILGTHWSCLMQRRSGPCADGL
jgi:hypothetical protein